MRKALLVANVLDANMRQLRISIAVGLIALLPIVGAGSPRRTRRARTRTVWPWTWGHGRVRAAPSSTSRAVLAGADL